MYLADTNKQLIIYIDIKIIYTTIHKFVAIKIFLESLFLKNVSYAQQGCIYLIKNTVILWKKYYNFLLKV